MLLFELLGYFLYLFLYSSKSKKYAFAVQDSLVLGKLSAFYLVDKSSKNRIMKSNCHQSNFNFIKIHLFFGYVKSENWKHVVVEYLPIAHALV